MNTQIRRLGIFLILCYIALFVKINQVQVFQADELANDPNNRALIGREYNRPRGAITSADGALLAQSVDVDPSDNSKDAKRVRVYPEKDLFAQITGYFSLTYGATGVEKVYSDELSAATVQQQIRGLGDLFSTQNNVGNVKVTVRKDLQQVARDALGEREGSIVAMDPKTGAILAFWSYPSFDPNLLSAGDHDSQTAAWNLLNGAPGNPLQAKQYQERYFPGSTFKVVTGSIGVQTGKVTDTDPVYPTATFYKPSVGKPIANFGGESCGGALPLILQQSCNSAFAQMGAETIGSQDMNDGASSFGFNQTVPIDLTAPAQSSFPATTDKDSAILAQASIGQNNVQATPLQMALVTSAVANKGVMMTPHVLSEVTDGEGRTVKTYDPSKWLQPLDEADAATMRQDMLGVVTGGTGTPAQVPGYEVAGKTGTAQLGDGKHVHTWMVAMGGDPGADPQVVVSVVILNQNAYRDDNTGGVIAGPVAGKVIKAALDEMKAAGVTSSGGGATPTTAAPAVTPPTTPLGGQNNTPNGQTGNGQNFTGPPSTPAKNTATVTSAPVVTTVTTTPTVSVTSTSVGPAHPTGTR